MRSFTLAAAALLCGTSALAQSMSGTASDQNSNHQTHNEPTIQPGASGAVSEVEAPKVAEGVGASATTGAGTMDSTMSTAAPVSATTTYSATGTGPATATTTYGASGTTAASPAAATTTYGATAADPAAATTTYGATSTAPASATASTGMAADPAASATLSGTTAAPAATAGTTMATDPAAGMASSQTMTTTPQETAMGPTTKVLAVGNHYTVHRVMPDGTVMVKTLTGEDAKMAMNGQTPAALAQFMTMGDQMAAAMPAPTYTAGAGTSSMAMGAPTPEASGAATTAIASYDANKDGSLTPLEFAQHVIATSAPAAGGDAALSSEARRELRSRASGNGATKLLNQTSDEWAMADRNRDFRVDSQELAMWHSTGMPNMATAMSMTAPATAISPGAPMTSGAGMSSTAPAADAGMSTSTTSAYSTTAPAGTSMDTAAPPADTSMSTSSSMTTGAGTSSSTMSTDAPVSGDTTMTTGTSAPITSATMTGTSPDGTAASTTSSASTTSTTDNGTTPTPSN